MLNCDVKTRNEVNRMESGFWNLNPLFSRETLEREPDPLNRMEDLILSRKTLQSEQIDDPIKLLTALGKYAYMIKTKRAPLPSRSNSPPDADADVKRNERHRWGMLEARCEEEVEKFIESSVIALKDTKFPRVLDKKVVHQWAYMQWRKVRYFCVLESYCQYFSFVKSKEVTSLFFIFDVISEYSMEICLKKRAIMHCAYLTVAFVSESVMVL